VVAEAQQKSIAAKERQAELERDRDAQTAGKHWLICRTRKC
jgi:hypothetical protein